MPEIFQQTIIQDIGQRQPNSSIFDVESQLLHSGSYWDFFINHKHVYKLRVVLYEEFLNALGKVSKDVRRPDLMVYTTESESYFIIHELSTGSSANKRKDGKHQLDNTVQMLNRIPEIKQYLSSFTHRLCILSGVEGAVNTPLGMADAFSEIYRQVAEPEPLNCTYCKRGGFDAYITHNVVLE